MVEKSKKSSAVSARFKPSFDPDDGPEWTDEMLDRAEIRDGDKVIRPGRPPLDDLINGVTIRLDADVLESYRALGEGWQTQVNADLRRARKLGAKVKRA